MKVEFSENIWSVLHDGKIVVESSPDNPMVYAGVGSETVEMYRGNFNIEDYITQRIPLNITKAVEEGDSWLLEFGESIRIKALIYQETVEFKIEQLDSSINRFWFRLPAEQNEKVYGLGEQMSYFNLRGRHFPIWTSEPGVGRDKTTYITWRCDVEHNSGGDYYNTNYPQPTFISTKGYWLHGQCFAYADYDFRNENFHELQFWAVPEFIRIEFAKDMPDLLFKQSEYFGRQPLLPDWIYNGAILGLQGGTERVFNIAENSIENGLKIAGIWCQDWVGKLETSFGRRLLWDWRWNEEAYPNLPEKMKEYKEKGIRFLGYNNCYLLNKGVLYQEAKEKGYFVVGKDGGEYLVDFGEFYCGVVDLTNPEAFDWYKECIKKYMLDFGIDGWMADFGEYLPIDIKLHNNVSPMLMHNEWPALWAKCNYEAVLESGKKDEVVYFMRAGAIGTQKYCPLLWAGDQSVDFSTHDGLQTTIVAALSAGMTGCGLNHSDIGGYTSLYDNLRSKELFLRWVEMAVFTPVMRTHEGNRPDTNFQYYDDLDAIKQFARLVDIHVALKPYIKDLVAENAEKGLPVQRPLFLHYPEDQLAYDIQTEYLFGKDMLIAPVLEKDQSEWKVYLPDDQWVHLWSGKEYMGGEYLIEAPIGKIPVFYRKESAYSQLFESLLGK